jgi:hypothetical protein
LPTSSLALRRVTGVSVVNITARFATCCKARGEQNMKQAAERSTEYGTVTLYYVMLWIFLDLNFTS